MRVFLFLFFVVLCFSVPSASLSASEGMGDTLQPISFEKMTLNRQGEKISYLQRLRFPEIATGFKWNKGDNTTDKFRPQGIAGMVRGENKFLIVSWYGRKEANYEDRGVRLSFVDVTDMDNIRYRHVLLVDEQLETFVGMHGGGLVYRAGMIHVPDSRSGEQKIRVFPLDSLQFVPKSMRSHYHNYAYILVQKREYSVPVTPSFLSMDWDRNQYLTGKFKECTGKHSSNSNCRNHQSAQLCWIDAEREVADSPACGPFFCNMQGAASAKNPESKKDVLWIACSYGRARSSLLHVVELNRDHKTMEGIKLVGHRQLKFPPGLEDLHVSKTSDNLWLLTEFGPHEGIGNNRVVFAIKRSSFLPESN